MSVIFPQQSTSWLVQAYGNAMFSTTTELIKEGLITVNHKYIFVQLGGNQIRSVDYNKVFGMVIDMVVTIRNKAPNVKFTLWPFSRDRLITPTQNRSLSNLTNGSIQQ